MRADRLLSLTMLLQKNIQMTAEALAEELEVSQRTIYRDVDALSAAGIPVYAIGGPGGGYALLDSYRTTLTGLRESEVRTLFMLTLPGPLVDLGVSQELKGTILKLTQSLSQSHLEQAEVVRQRLHLDSARWFQTTTRSPHLRVVQQAIWNDQQIDLIYRRANGKTSQRIVNPYGLVAKAGLWYLIAESERGFIVYRISRIESVGAQETYFVRSDAFDLIQYWEGWVTDYETSLPQYPIKMRVNSEAAVMLPFVLGEPIQQALSDSQIESDGWQTLSYTFERHDEARMFALGMGPLIEILEPEVLRLEVIKLAKETVNHYSN
ncbi:MAG: helix-turn-helix transcriptional regulator [Anaerolineae bacterium]